MFKHKYVKIQGGIFKFFNHYSVQFQQYVFYSMQYIDRKDFIIQKIQLTCENLHQYACSEYLETLRMAKDYTASEILQNPEVHSN